jgi:hypothetical protein
MPELFVLIHGCTQGTYPDGPVRGIVRMAIGRRGRCVRLSFAARRRVELPNWLKRSSQMPSKSSRWRALRDATCRPGPGRIVMTTKLRRNGYQLIDGADPE